MNKCISSNLDFLKKVVSNIRIIDSASSKEIACLIEILFNVHKIPFNRAERNSIVKFLPVIRYLGKIRNTEKARDLLKTFAKHFLFVIVQAVLSKK